MKEMMKNLVTAGPPTGLIATTNRFADPLTHGQNGPFAKSGLLFVVGGELAQRALGVGPAA
ncbi:MAG: hypothetical protein NZ533_06865 [Casimicrobiaceae bacterium]|nr:hypothetical protein [Casimicrobiaceae bacterium]